MMREVKHQYCHLLESRDESLFYNDTTQITPPTICPTGGS
jgi:hypothetical protein